MSRLLTTLPNWLSLILKIINTYILIEGSLKSLWGNGIKILSSFWCKRLLRFMLRGFFFRNTYFPGIFEESSISKSKNLLTISHSLFCRSVLHGQNSRVVCQEQRIPYGINDLSHNLSCSWENPVHRSAF